MAENRPFKSAYDRKAEALESRIRYIEKSRKYADLTAAEAPQATPNLITDKAVRAAVKDARKAQGEKFDRSALARQLKDDHPGDDASEPAIRRRVLRALELTRR